VAASSPAKVSASSPAKVATSSPAKVAASSPAKVAASSPTKVAASSPAKVSVPSPAKVKSVHCNNGDNCNPVEQECICDCLGCTDAVMQSLGVSRQKKSTRSLSLSSSSSEGSYRKKLFMGENIRVVGKASPQKAMF
jgi:hypothetical protein